MPYPLRMFYTELFRFFVSFWTVLYGSSTASFIFPRFYFQRRWYNHILFVDIPRWCWNALFHDSFHYFCCQNCKLWKTEGRNTALCITYFEKWRAIIANFVLHILEDNGNITAIWTAHFGKRREVVQNLVLFIIKDEGNEYCTSYWTFC